MSRGVFLVLAAVLLHAQESSKPADEPKPPAKVDQALRARANQYYEDFVKGRFSDAESLVAPESKNAFVALRKEQYISCEIKTIKYSNRFAFADVGAICGRNILMEGFAGHPLDWPVGSQWKLEHGKWYWWFDPNTPRQTPFGMMGAMMAANGAGAPAEPAIPQPKLPTAAELSSPAIAMHKVRPDKESLTLKAGESGALVFSNSATGPMSFWLDSAPAGFEIAPTHADLQANGKATVTVKALDGAKPAALNFRVYPTGETIAVKVVIQ
jgi:hypothetical protein